MRFLRKKSFRKSEISPDEIFLDSQNSPGFDQESFEGMLEKAIPPRVPLMILAVFAVVLFGLAARAGDLQVIRGDGFYERSRQNTLKLAIIEPERGVIYDRNGKKLVWNELREDEEKEGAWERVYTKDPGLSHLLGFVGYVSESDQKSEAAQDAHPRLLPGQKIGKAGVEKEYEDFLRGTTGARLVEVNSLGAIVSESVQKNAESGNNLILTVDADLQSKLFQFMEGIINDRGFAGGAGIITSVDTGEVLAITSWPEFDSNILSSGISGENMERLLGNSSNPFFFRAVSGVYAPGSVFKPIVALAALNEGVINPLKQIFSSGSISIPNPYNPDFFTVFYDNKAHGWVDMRRALAVSSNVYFYAIGGGFEDVGGLGVSRIKKYARIFGFGEKTGIDLPGEATGMIPDSDWKTENVKDGMWRLGDTYNLSIGQGWTQVTPIQMASLASIIANDGKIITPSILKEVEALGGKWGAISEKKLTEAKKTDIPPEHFSVVKEGMRLAVLEGTAKPVSGLRVSVAGKTGTAEIGSGKFVNSWFIGFAPYENPKIAIAIVMERGRAENFVGAPHVARQILEWIIENRPEYL